MMVELFELCPFIPLSVTLIVFRGHSRVEEFLLEILCSYPIKIKLCAMLITPSRSCIYVHIFCSLFFFLFWSLHLYSFPVGPLLNTDACCESWRTFQHVVRTSSTSCARFKFGTAIIVFAFGWRACHPAAVPCGGVLWSPKKRSPCWGTQSYWGFPQE